MATQGLASEAQRAARLLQGGHVSQAEALCRQIIALEPRSFQALHLLGIIALKGAQYPRAAEFFGAAVDIDPSEPAAHSNLAASLTALGRAQEALGFCDRALALRGDFAQGLSNSGDALAVLGRPGEALESYTQAIAAAPQLFAAHLGHANALLALHRESEALESYENALRLDSRSAEALANQGMALLKLHRPARALARFEGALVIAPQLPEALNGRGCALRILHRLPEAIDSFSAALRARPGWAAASYNQAKACLDAGDYAQAVACCDRALALAPQMADAHNIKATALRSLHRFQEAAEAYQALLRIDVHFNYALGNQLRCRDLLCDWRGRDEAVALVREGIARAERSCLPFCFLALSDHAAEQQRCARLWIERDGALPLEEEPRHETLGRLPGNGRIRVAYVSPDFRDHAVTQLLVRVLERHDRTRFETFGISLQPERPSGLGQRVARAFEHFIDVSRSADAEVVDLLRRLQIDIAVDLCGLTAGARSEVFAQRCAPVQVNYLGYPGTLGASYMDYIIADQFVIPAPSACYYSEQVVYLPDCFQANDDERTRAPRVPTRAEEGLAEGSFVFSCFNASYKLNPQIFSVWMRLLRQTPGSTLWLLGSSDGVRANLRREAAERDVAPHRLIFAEHRTYAEHLARLPLADLFLDTLPFNGGATASDALWVGLPLLTCAGEAFAARMAGSLVRAAGLPQSVTFSLQEYEAQALHLATHPKELRAMRDHLTLERRRLALFDTERFCRRLEAAYEHMLRA